MDSGSFSKARNAADAFSKNMAPEFGCSCICDDLTRNVGVQYFREQIRDGATFLAAASFSSFYYKETEFPYHPPEFRSFFLYLQEVARIYPRTKTNIHGTSGTHINL